MKTVFSKTAKRRALAALTAGFALFSFAEKAEAQEILLTGPLAGAPAVRKLRLYRQGRFEFAPSVSFTLLDEYQRTILFGARLNYNITDWLGIGVWGAHGTLKLPTALTGEIQDVNEARGCMQGSTAVECRLTAVNLGDDFKDQLGTIDWVVAPQLTGVPFRGKLGLFSSVFVDTDLYFFAGPAFVGVTERDECGADTDGPADCTARPFETVSRVAIAPTFGLGLTFYINEWSAIGAEYRALPFAFNNGGFDVAGGGKDNKFPDQQIDSDDQQFRFNQLINLSFNIYLPTKYKVSE